MFPSEMVRLKIVEPSSGPLCPCFPRKWYALKLSNPQVVHFVHVSLANGTTLKLSNPQAVHFGHVSLALMVRLKIVEPSNGPLSPCFPRKWHTLKLFKHQVVYFVHVSLSNGTP